MGIFEDYFVKPILQNEGYNAVNTLAYALVAVVALYFLYGYLKDRKVLKQGFVLAVIPYILFAAVLRVVNDCCLKSYLLVSPPIYIFIFAIFATIFLASRFTKTDFKRNSALMLVPAASLLFLMYLVPNMAHIDRLFRIMGLFLAVEIPVQFIISRYGLINDGLFRMALMCHIFDASSTFVGLESGYFEQHVLANQFINIFGPAGMYVMKLLFLVPLLWYLEKDTKKEEKVFAAAVVIILGLAPGLRNMLRIVMGI